MKSTTSLIYECQVLNPYFLGVNVKLSAHSLDSINTSIKYN